MAASEVKLVVDQGAMHQLKEGLAMGVGELAHETVARAEARKPKRSVARVVTTLAGAILEGADAPAGGTVAQAAAYAVFSEPAGYVEFGTAAHVIKPKGKSVLKLGDKGFATVVDHPGAHAKPFINPALIGVASNPEPALRAGVAKRWR